MEVSPVPDTGPVGPSAQTLQLIRRLKDFYAEFSVDTLSGLDAVYTQDVEFRDPVHILHGCLALKSYLRRMGGNLLQYRMRYLEEQINVDNAWFCWELDFAHRHLKGGQVITVRGMTRVRFTSRIYSHEDCYDMGALLYEQIPLLGGVVRMLKRRLGA